MSRVSPAGETVTEGTVAGMRSEGAGSGGGRHPVPVVLRWPEAAELRRELAGSGRPRLLLVPAGAPPPRPADLLEDWVRLPASSEDIEARLESLADRVVALGAVPAQACDRTVRSVSEDQPAVDVDEDGRVHRNGRWVALSGIEADLMRTLVAAGDAVVSREEIMEAAWPGDHPSRNVLDVHMMRLRRRLGEVDLGVRTVRGRGFVLEHGDS